MPPESFDDNMSPPGAVDDTVTSAEDGWTAAIATMTRMATWGFMVFAGFGRKTLRHHPVGAME